MAHRSGTQTVAALRHRSNTSSLYALRAVAHSANLVQPGAAPNAALSDPPFVAVKENQEVKVGHGQRPCWTATTPLPSAPQAGSNAVPAKTAASPIRAGCARNRMQLQSVQRLGLSLAKLTTVLANHSLNRTHCSRPPKARHFILGL